MTPTSGHPAHTTRQPRELHRPVRRCAGGVEEFRDYLKTHKTAGERLRQVDESSRQLTSAIDRASRFSIWPASRRAAGGRAVAMGAQRYVKRHIDAVALMKCMGASQNFVLSISVIELTRLAAAAVALARCSAISPNRAGVAAARPDQDRTAARFTRAASHRAGDGSRHADRLRAAAAAAAEEPPRRGFSGRPSPHRRCVTAHYVLAIGALFAILWSLVRDAKLVADLFAGVLGVGAALAAAATDW